MHEVPEAATNNNITILRSDKIAGNHTETLRLSFEGYECRTLER
jgi:hypothetical protein